MKYDSVAVKIIQKLKNSIMTHFFGGQMKHDEYYGVIALCWAEFKLSEDIGKC